MSVPSHKHQRRHNDAGVTSHHHRRRHYDGGVMPTTGVSNINALIHRSSASSPIHAPTRLSLEDMDNITITLSPPSPPVTTTFDEMKPVYPAKPSAHVATTPRSTYSLIPTEDINHIPENIAPPPPGKFVLETPVSDMPMLHSPGMVPRNNHPSSRSIVDRSCCPCFVGAWPQVVESKPLGPDTAVKQLEAKQLAMQSQIHAPKLDLSEDDMVHHSSHSLGQLWSLQHKKPPRAPPQSALQIDTPVVPPVIQMQPCEFKDWHLVCQNLWYYIFKFLPASHVSQCALVCKKWRETSRLVPVSLVACSTKQIPRLYTVWPHLRDLHYSARREPIDDVIRVLTSQPGPHSLDLASFDGSLLRVFTALQQCEVSPLRRLSMPFKRVVLPCSQALAGLLRNGRPALEDLDLTWVNICDEGAEILAQGIAENTTLKRLILARTAIAGKYFAEMLGKNTSLLMLSLQATRTCAADCSILAHSLSVNNTLKELRLNDLFLANEGGTALAAGLRHNTCLEILEMQSTALGSEAAAAIASGLSLNTALLTLDLRRNDFSSGRVVGAAFAELLSLNQTLRSLDLQDTKLGPAAGRGLAAGLKTNGSLRVLNIKYNAIGDAGGRALGEVLSTNTSLRTLDLQTNSMGSLAGVAIGGGLAENTGLRRLCMSNNTLGDGAAQCITQALLRNTTLTALDLSETKVGNNTARALVHALQVNAALHEIKIQGHNMSAQAANSVSLFRRPGSSCCIVSV